MLNRREFVFGLAGIVASSKAISSSTPRVVNCEVLIIGSGSAGLFAAINARQAGAKNVLVIEKNPSPFFSSSAFSAGSVNASGTLAQKEHGIDDEDGKEEFKQEILEEGNHKNDIDLVDIYVANAAPALDWFTRRGVKLTPAPNVAFHKKRMHGCDRATGAQYMELLFAEARNLGVQFLFNTKATRLVCTEVSKVESVEAIQRQNKLILRASMGIILATGGYAGDLEQIDREAPAFRGSSTFASPSSRGEGLHMAQDIGAATLLLSYAGAYAYGFSLDAETRRGLIFRGHVMNLYGSISLNDRAERFVNDDWNATKVAQRMVDLGMSTVYQLATERHLKDFMQNDPIQVIGWDKTMFVQELEEGKYFAKRLNSLEEVASAMGVAKNNLEQTINRYNAMVREGVDKDFGRKSLKGEFSTGPFYLFKGRPIVGTTIGGLKVNKHLQVLHSNGQTIRNLYAAGEIVGGLHGTSYIGGNSLGGAFALGRYVGKEIVANHTVTYNRGWSAR